jgi:hypothetical protein
VNGGGLKVPPVLDGGGGGFCVVWSGGGCCDVGFVGPISGGDVGSGILIVGNGEVGNSVG